MKENKMYIKQIYKNNEFVVLATIVKILLNQVLNIGMIVFQQILVDTMSGVGLEFTSAVIIFVIFIFVVIAICLINIFVDSKFEQKALLQFKSYTMKRILNKKLSSFNQESTATFIAAMTNDIYTIVKYYISYLFMFLDMGLLITTALVVMFLYDWKLSIVSLLLMLIPTLLGNVFGNKLVQQNEEVSNNNETMIDSINDITNGFTVVKSFRAENAVQREFANADEGLEQAKLARDKTSIAQEASNNIISMSILSVVLLIGAWAVLNGYGLTAGIVLSFRYLLGMILEPLNQFSTLIGLRKSARALLNKLVKNIENYEEDDGLVIESGLNKQIAIKDLSYSYDDVDMALEQISLDIEANKSYAIVGASGSGKSSLLNVLMGTNHGYTGSVKLDDVELRAIELNSLYQTFALIQQSTFIFNSSILNNITMYQDFTQAEVEAAIQASGLSQVVEEKGLYFNCGENGNNLSGGEKQRISIARALLKESSVLLLDEATASIDNETANAINQAILDIKNCTKVVISHNLNPNLMQQYDCIYVLKDGRLIEQGQFEELISNQEYFYSLYVLSE